MAKKSKKSEGAAVPAQAASPPKRLVCEFLDNVGGKLEIYEDSDGEFSDCELRANVHDNKTGRDRRLTRAELDSVAFRGKQIKLRGLSEDVVSHNAPNGEFFTVQDLLHAVDETERQTRGRTQELGSSCWCHIFFEGIGLAADGVWSISWGS
jgi:hypothetical protein